MEFGGLLSGDEFENLQHIASGLSDSEWECCVRGWELAKDGESIEAEYEYPIPYNREDLDWSGRQSLVVPRAALCNREGADAFLRYEKARIFLEKSPEKVRNYRRAIICAQREKDALDGVITSNDEEDPANKCLRGRVGTLARTIQNEGESLRRHQRTIATQQAILQNGWKHAIPAHIHPHQTRLPLDVTEK